MKVEQDVCAICWLPDGDQVDHDLDFVTLKRTNEGPWLAPGETVYEYELKRAYSRPFEAMWRPFGRRHS